MAESSLPADVRGRLSDFLRERQEDILAEWEAAVRKTGAGRDLDRPLLLDQL